MIHNRGWHDVIKMAEALGRERSLSEAELDIVQHAITRCNQNGTIVVKPNWTTSDDAKLIKAAKARVPHAIIAINLGRTPCAIRGRIKRLNKLKSARFRTRIKAMRDEG